MGTAKHRQERKKRKEEKEGEEGRQKCVAEKNTSIWMEGLKVHVVVHRSCNIRVTRVTDRGAAKRNILG